MDNIEIKNKTERLDADENYADDNDKIEAEMARKKESVEAERKAKEEKKRIEEEEIVFA